MTLMLVAAGLLACAEDERAREAAPVAGATASSSSSVGGAASGGGGSAGEGGAGAATGGGGAGGTETQLCVPNLAFGDTGIAFLPPTAAQLAQALGTLTYDYHDTPRSLSVVLLEGQGNNQPDVAVSGSVENSNYLHEFRVGSQPTKTAVAFADASFASATPQATGYLLLVDDNGTVSVEIENLRVDAKPNHDCSSVVATLDAVIPHSQAGVLLTIGGNASTIEQLGGSVDPMVGWQLHAVFQAESIPFDFDSTP